VGEGGGSNHLHKLLQIETDDQEPPGPFKFSHTSLEDEWLRNLVTLKWRKFYPNIGESIMFQFAEDC
jgi:hypothetical protein